MIKEYNPLISVIIPCYNQACFLPEGLGSILAQNYSNWECIIINDGSTDNTDEVANAWLQKDKRLKYINKENGGRSSARIAGLTEAKGEFIQFLDADDIIAREKFDKQLQIFQQKPVTDVVYSDFLFFSENKPEGFKENRIVKIPGDPLNAFLFKWGKKFIIPIHCALFRSSIIKEKDLHLELEAREDWLLWISLAMSNVKFHYIDEELAFYRKHGASTIHNEKVMIENTVKSLFLVYEVLPINKKERFRNEYAEYISLKFDIKNKQITTIENSLPFKFVKNMVEIKRKFKNFLVLK